MTPSASWPRQLWVVRHGESAGNVARDLAEANALERIDLASRDVDIPLSDLGVSQSAALGAWTASLPAEERPTVVWSSPYVRAQQTAHIAMEHAGLELPAVLDERLREREFGLLDGLTRRGITALYPEEAQRRSRLGKFYHRPPGGESWSDVLLRLRGALDDIRRECPDERVLIVAHQVVVLLVRCVVERLTEAEILAIDAAGDVANCSVTSYRRGPDGLLVLQQYNEVTALVEQDEPVTSEPDVPAAPR
ncbi:MAG TPA: histidine phosphatase family protein [Mycobacteriales bacterium]|nr:histidine phosphatase family protein [Mycobacteriales bacterium]